MLKRDSAGAYSSEKVTTTVWSSGVSIDSIWSYPDWLFTALPGFITASHVNLTSREVKGWPSDQVTSSRRR